MSWRAIYHLLSDGQMRTAKEIAAATGLERSAIFKELKAHKPEFVRIGGYSERSNNGSRAIKWAYGHGPDARKPKPESRSVIAKRHWNRMKKERIDAMDRRNALRQLRKDEAAGKFLKRDIAAAWL